MGAIDQVGRQLRRPACRPSRRLHQQRIERRGTMCQLGLRVEPRIDQLAVARRAESDRGRHAVGPDRAAFVRHAGRQVQHVAGTENPFALRLEVRQDLQRQVRQQREVTLAADPPPPVSVQLQQEHVVGIDMGADAAAVAGMADHHVVEAGVADEAEALAQRGGGRQHQVHALHQQRPARPLARRQLACLERSVSQRPAVVECGDQTRLDVVAPGQREQCCPVDRCLAQVEGVADQPRLPLPGRSHEVADGQGAEAAQRCGGCAGHGWENTGGRGARMA